VSGYLENRRLFQQAEARAAELAVLNELGQVLPTRLDVDSVLFEGYHAAFRLLRASDFYVTLYETGQYGGGQIVFPLIVEGGQTRRPYHRRPADRKGLTEYLVETRRPLLIREGVGDHAASLLQEMGVESISLGTGRQALSWLGVPMMVGDRVLGTMVALSFTQSGFYDEHDQELLVAIANRVAVALENVRLLERAQARAQQERLVRTITDRVRRGVDRQAIMRVALREMGEMLGASAGMVRLGTGASLQEQVGVAEPEDGPQHGAASLTGDDVASLAGDGDSHTDGTQEGG
jgi:GAF domain-containing protein